ncbi:hypothetical protein BDW72DRAFT_176440, partial [Aspergillus terricola var. indicus]
MATKEKATPSAPRSSSSPAPSQAVTILRDIVRSPRTLYFIALLSPLMRWIWNFMGWPNGVELALSLNNGLLILYLIISQYLRRY